MKSILTLVLVLLAASFEVAAAPSTQFMSIDAQDKEIQKIAKGIRREYWVSGHQDVDSYEFHMSKEALDEHLESNGQYEDSLDDDEISSLYRCHYSKSCELYQVSVSANYWGGDGNSAHFILLYTKSGKHFEISLITYAE